VIPDWSSPRVTAFLADVDEVQRKHGLHLEASDGQLEVRNGYEDFCAFDETEEARQRFHASRTEELWGRLEALWLARLAPGGRDLVRGALLRLMDHTRRYTPGHRRRQREAREVRFAETAKLPLFAQPLVPKLAHLCPTRGCARLLGHNGDCTP